MSIKDNKVLQVVKQAVKDKWKGEHRCSNHPCNELSMGSPVQTVSGYIYYCGKHKVAGGGTKPKNVLAAAEKKAAAASRRRERGADTDEDGGE